jgi:hypothetical protein
LDFRFALPGTSKSSRENQDDENNQDNADDSDAAVTVAVTVATEAATEATKQEDDEDDDEDESERHAFSPRSERPHRRPVIYLLDVASWQMELVTVTRALTPTDGRCKAGQSFVFRTLALRTRLNTTEQAGLSCSLLRTRQETMRLASGMSCWQSRMTSGVQAA